jgi:hypothetical protein
MTTEDEDENDDDDQDDDDEDGRHDIGGDEMDDEPILGFWMESVMSPPEMSERDSDGSFLKDRDGKGGLAGEARNAEDGIKALIEEFIRDRDSPSDVSQTKRQIRIDAQVVRNQLIGLTFGSSMCSSLSQH